MKRESLSLGNKFNFFKNIKSYQLTDLKADLMAGLSVAAISLPQNMAYALIVGVSPIYGVYTTIISMILFTFMGVSNYMIVGPTNIMAMALASSLNGIGQENYLEVLFLLTFLIGLSQLLFALLGIGKLVNYISYSLIVGLSTGAIVMIGVGQFKNFLGLSIKTGPNLYTKIYNIITNIDQINWVAVSLGLFTILTTILIQKLKPKWPSYLIALIIVSLGTYILNLNTQVALVGELPKGLMKVEMLSFDLSLIDQLASKALSVAFLGLIQTLAVFQSLAIKTEEEIEVNNEFIGQGIINMITSFFNGFAIAGSFSNSFVNYQAGAMTKFAQAFAALTIVLLLALFGFMIKYVPIVGLASLVIVVAFNSINLAEIKSNLKTTKGDALIFIITFLATISFSSIDTAIYIGLLTSTLVVLKQSEEVNLGVISYEQEEENYLVEKEISKLEDEAEKDNCMVIDISGNLHFSSSEKFKDRLDSIYQKGDNFVIRVRNLQRMDLTVIRELNRFIDNIQNREGKVMISGVKEEQYKKLNKYGIIKKVGKNNVFFSKDKLFASTKKAVDSTKD